MIRRSPTAADIATKIGNHTFRVTGITAYLQNGATLEKAAASVQLPFAFSHDLAQFAVDEKDRKPSLLALHLNKLTRTFAAQMSALKEYRSKGEQKMTVQHVHVAEGGQAIVGNVSAPASGGGANEKAGEQPHALGYASGAEMPRQIEEERAPVPRALRSDSVCRMHGAGGGAREGNRNALKHGASSAETLALKRRTTALARLARETMVAIE